MHILMVPGLWLDASSWDEVTPLIEAAGHTPHPLTMPGVGADAADSAGIGMADWVAALVAEIDRLDGPVVLVGHSGGGNVVWGAADARPERVARIVFVDSFPPGDGGIVWEFPVVDGVIPFPGWDTFEENEVSDLDEGTRVRVAAQAKAVPAAVPTDPIRLNDERRRDVSTTVITSTVSTSDMRELLAQAPEWIAELGSIRDLELVDLPGGHWPQFAQPRGLGDALVRALGD